MTLSELVIGQPYQLGQSHGIYLGLSEDGIRARFHWLVNNAGWAQGIKIDGSNFPRITHNDPKTKVSLKIKLLWNTSNYVKNNPKQVY